MQCVYEMLVFCVIVTFSIDLSRDPPRAEPSRLPTNDNQRKKRKRRAVRCTQMKAHPAKLPPLERPDHAQFRPNKTCVRLAGVWYVPPRTIEK